MSSDIDCSRDAPRLNSIKGRLMGLSSGSRELCKVISSQEPVIQCFLPGRWLEFDLLLKKETWCWVEFAWEAVRHVHGGTVSSGSRCSVIKPLIVVLMHWQHLGYAYSGCFFLPFNCNYIFFIKKCNIDCFSCRCWNLIRLNLNLLLRALQNFPLSKKEVSNENLLWDVFYPTLKSEVSLFSLTHEFFF